jgi:hypothetical protein
MMLRNGKIWATNMDAGAEVETDRLMDLMVAASAKLGPHIYWLKFQKLNKRV